PSRIVKLSGTPARKGDSLPRRPHRRAESAFSPHAGVVTEAQLRALAAMAPAPEPQRPSQNGHGSLNGPSPDYDIPALLEAAGVGYHERDKGYATVYELECCLSSNDHTDGAALFRFPSGAVAFSC